MLDRSRTESGPGWPPARDIRRSWVIRSATRSRARSSDGSEGGGSSAISRGSTAPRRRRTLAGSSRTSTTRRRSTCSSRSSTSCASTSTSRPAPRSTPTSRGFKTSVVICRSSWRRSASTAALMASPSRPTSSTGRSGPRWPQAALGPSCLHGLTTGMSHTSPMSQPPRAGSRWTIGTSASRVGIAGLSLPSRRYGRHSGASRSSPRIARPGFRSWSAPSTGRRPCAHAWTA